MLQLVIGNKCYSSWSLRPWLLLRQLGVPFQEVLIPLDRPDTRERVLAHSPAGKMPVLVDGTVRVWESLAIMDHVADHHAPGRVWPQDPAARAMARSVAAEMHAGFSALRSALPMNLGKRFAHRDRGEGAARDIARIQDVFRTAREAHGAGGPFLFGAFSAADAMYAPVATRLDTYSVPLDPVSAEYVGTMLALPAFRAWREAALAEPWIVEHDELDEEPIETFRTGADA